ncbi:MAG: hypothetical protein M3430_22450 [Acidobacteriota bacterium]|nr:hypothetical protein [Acidobacteriota bacterium]
MSEFQLKDKGEVYEVIREAVAELGRTDTPFSYGVVDEEGAAGGQIVFFDLPRVSPLQFNLLTDGLSSRRQTVDRIKAMILQRLGDD